MLLHSTLFLNDSYKSSDFESLGIAKQTGLRS